jgi:hypothetical protein
MSARAVPKRRVELDENCGQPAHCRTAEFRWRNVQNLHARRQLLQIGLPTSASGLVNSTLLILPIDVAAPGTSRANNAEAIHGPNRPVGESRFAAPISFRLAAYERIDMPEVPR